MDAIKETIGDRIAKLRKKTGLTQLELAKKLNLSDKAVSKWESSKGDPSLEFLPALSKIFDCTIDYLVVGKEAECEDKNKATLQVSLGIDEKGETYMTDLHKQVHMFVYGADSVGKNMLLHNIIQELTINYPLHYVKLTLIDLKNVEFNHYKYLPNLYIPVSNNAKSARDALELCFKELERRYELLGNLKFNNIKQYNSSEMVKMDQSKYLPFIVIIIDELADLYIDRKQKHYINDALVRITQLGRCVGIHIIATSCYPNLDDTLIQFVNNCPSRICFKVNSATESEKILGKNGAEELQFKNEMLSLPIDKQVTSKIKIENIEEAKFTKFITEHSFVVEDKIKEVCDEKMAERLLYKLDKNIKVQNVHICNLLKGDFISCIDIQITFMMNHAKALTLIELLENLGFIRLLEHSNIYSIVYDKEVIKLVIEDYICYMDD